APLYGMHVVAHCEDLYLADGGKINEGEISEKLGVKGIPAAAEDCGTAREIALAAALDVPVHICHVSTKTSVELIRDAKNRGVKVTAETAPHYFSLTDRELLRGDADFRMNPPLRTISDMDEIINGLLDGTLDAIATDHAPHTVEDKADFISAPNGSIGMETSLAVGITCLVKRGLLSFEKLVEKMSVNPARILGINAGTLAVGAPADIALVDLDEEWVVDVDKLHGKSKNTPFKSRRLCGKVKKTILGGKVVFYE
ncbi:MAG: amidohydrolase family protein, partial [Ruminococcus sp.]